MVYSQASGMAPLHPAEDTMTKAERHAAIRARAERAILALYHNATPNYPRLDDFEAERFDAWFEDAARHEIEYMNDGGAYPGNYAETLAHPANGGRYTSRDARTAYIRKGMADRALDRAKYATWEWTSERFGKLYQWGRGGRTLAPDRLVQQRGGSTFRLVRDYFETRTIAETVEGIRILESFNEHVRCWCQNVPDMFKEETEADATEAAGILEFAD